MSCIILIRPALTIILIVSACGVFDAFDGFIDPCGVGLACRFPIFRPEMRRHVLKLCFVNMAMTVTQRYISRLYS